MSAGDEVLVSDFTFPASGNVIVQLGAIPVLVDSERDRFVLDLDDAKSKVTAGRGPSCRSTPSVNRPPWTEVVELADAHDLAVVEDAACALGSSIDGQSCGSWRMRAVQLPSAQGRHHGRRRHGGHERCRAWRPPALLRNHGGEPGGVGQNFVENGFNYRLGEIPAALGSAQLRRLDRSSPIAGERPPVTAGRSTASRA